MKKLTLLLATVLIAGGAYACDGSKDCCKKGQKNGKACCNKEAAAKSCDKKGCDKNTAKKEDAKETTTASSKTATHSHTTGAKATK